MKPFFKQPWASDWEATLKANDESFMGDYKKKHPKNHSTANSTARAPETRSLVCKHLAPLCKQIKISSLNGLNRPTAGEARVFSDPGSDSKWSHRTKCFRLAGGFSYWGDCLFLESYHVLRSCGRNTLNPAWIPASFCHCSKSSCQPQTYPIV